jgi:hypothetical protein
MFNRYYKFHKYEKSFQSFFEYIFIFLVYSNVHLSQTYFGIAQYKFGKNEFLAIEFFVL